MVWSDTIIKENIGSIKRLGMVIKGAVDNTLLHVLHVLKAEIGTGKGSF